MRIDLYWRRFMLKFEEHFNPQLEKRFAAEFIKDGRRYRIVLQVSEFPTDAQIHVGDSA